MWSWSVVLKLNVLNELEKAQSILLFGKASSTSFLSVYFIFFVSPVLFVDYRYLILKLRSPCSILFSSLFYWWGYTGKIVLECLKYLFFFSILSNVFTTFSNSFGLSHSKMNHCVMNLIGLLMTLPIWKQALTISRFTKSSIYTALRRWYLHSLKASWKDQNSWIREETLQWWNFPFC